MSNWNSEDILIMKKFIEIVKRGSRISGTEITQLYNRVLNKNVNPTNCSSCISQRYKELKQSYDAFETLLKEQEEKAKALEVLDELMTPTEEEITQVKRGRKKKE